MEETKKILHLTLKKKWFDMILSGEKKEEYREIKKFWEVRLKWKTQAIESFDIVRFRNGYAKNAPTMDVEFKGLLKGTGHYEWGGLAKEVYIIQLGKILETKNIA